LTVAGSRPVKISDRRHPIVLRKLGFGSNDVSTKMMWVQDLRRKPLYFIPIIGLLDRSHRVADSGLASIRVLDWIMYFVAQKDLRYPVSCGCLEYKLRTYPRTEWNRATSESTPPSPNYQLWYGFDPYCLDPSLHRDDRILWIAVRKGI
jgi:hypothetical protein